MSKHTPGPWHVKKLDDFTGITEIVSESGPIGKAYRNNDTATAERNARLIAATPDLLEVVEAMANFDGRCNNQHLKDMAKAALKKSKGRIT